MNKKVILMIVDALSKRDLIEQLNLGRLPNFQQLIDKSQLFTSSYSIFPSVTHACLTSIITGKYPYEHGVLASHWFEEDKQRVPYFSAEWNIVSDMGLGTFLANFIEDLNSEYVKTETIFQSLKKQGMRSTSINYFLYRGDEPHQLNIPFLLRLLPGMSSNGNTVYGPDQMFLGDLLGPESYGADYALQYNGVFNWYGLRDEESFSFLKHLIATEQTTPFNIVYFPKNDHIAHEQGPAAAHEQLTDFNDGLRELFAIAGGIDRFLQTYTVLISGDHSQGNIDSEPTRGSVDLAELLQQFAVSHTGSPWNNKDELLICPNLRAATIYAKPHVQTDDLVATLLQEPKIDQVIWRESEAFFVESAAGRLRFSRGHSFYDQFGNGWDLSGTTAAIDVEIVGTRLSYGVYPNAFERIEGALLHPHSGRVWVTAQLGSEFVVPGTSAHLGGGSHGSLHKVDSESILLVAGANAGVKLPQPARLIDIAPICLEALNG